ncbi:MAG TPA: aminoglycoside phosphotransferase, partial [Thermopetrobacter sp.]|nr:aminoglycoside phosphotransferase [Thermopetrobacter sp.]
GADILSAVAARHGVDAALARALAKTAAAAHRAAEVRHPPSGRAILAATIDDQLRVSFASHADALGEAAAALLARMEALLARHAARLDARVESGHVRRCHGDMHLGNIVLVDGRPTLFDAIEFSEDIATVDILYDLAFLLMDLVHLGHAGAANRVFNTWLAELDDEDNHATAGAVGLMLALRAAIRTMVHLDLADQHPPEERAATIARARAYLRTAVAAAAEPRLRLVAIGGLSGSGKTTLAAALAPLLAPGTGAVHLRSDVERKRMFGRDELERLPPSCYTPEISARVYERLARRARRVLASGWPVVVDAVYARPEEREAIARVAAEAGADFEGLWLDAPAEELLRRVDARRGDASDATPEVVRRQLRMQTGPLRWRRVDATGSPATVLTRVRRLFDPPLADGN